MSFSDIRENDRLVERLRQTVLSGRIFHGYIIEGRTEDTQALAQAFMSAHLCESGTGDACGECISCRKIAAGNSEDIVSIGIEGESVKDRDIEWLISRSIQKSYTGRRLFLLVKHADSMTLRAQNRLLKTLEEPPGGVTIILLTENSESLVQTIRSRCQLLKMFSDGMDETASTDSDFREKALSAAASLLFGGRAYSIWNQLNEFTASRQTASEFIAIAESLYRDVMISAYDRSGKLRINRDSDQLIAKCSRSISMQQAAEAVQCTETAARDLARNVSAGHAIKYMIFDIQEKLNDNSNRSQI